MLLTPIFTMTTDNEIKSLARIKLDRSERKTSVSITMHGKHVISFYSWSISFNSTSFNVQPRSIASIRRILFQLNWHRFMNNTTFSNFNSIIKSFHFHLCIQFIQMNDWFIGTICNFEIRWNKNLLCFQSWSKKRRNCLVQWLVEQKIGENKLAFEDTNVVNNFTDFNWGQDPKLEYKLIFFLHNLIVDQLKFLLFILLSFFYPIFH